MYGLNVGYVSHHTYTSYSFPLLQGELLVQITMVHTFPKAQAVTKYHYTPNMQPFTVF